jgi:hypothetical protein
MNWEGVAAIAACATLGLSALGSIAFLIWHAGRHSERLDGAESDIRDLKKIQDEHSKVLGGWEQFGKLLDEVRGDVKKLLSERGRSVGR